MSSFAPKFRTGRKFERIIEWWAVSKGHSVVPTYEKETNDGKGPRLLTPVGELVAPDCVVLLNNGGVVFIEAKNKSVFSWYWTRRYWVTGIDLRYYQD